jgi:protein TonB
MRLLVGVATATIVHGLVFGLGLLLLPRQAVPAPAPAQVDVDVVAARPEPIDRPPAPAAPVAPSLVRPHAPARRPQPRSQAVPAAVVTPEASSTVTVASAQPSAGAIVASRAAAPAQAGDVTPAQPQYRSNPAPEYPSASHRRREEGTVLLKVAVGADGLPTAVSLERSCGHRLLDDAALETVRRWTFAPARAGRVAVASVVIIPVRFAAAQADR